MGNGVHIETCHYQEKIKSAKRNVFQGDVHRFYLHSLELPWARCKHSTKR